MHAWYHAMASYKNNDVAGSWNETGTPGMQGQVGSVLHPYNRHIAAATVSQHIVDSTCALYAALVMVAGK
jgi:hypothetical protein